MRTRRTLIGVLVALRAWWWALGGAALIYVGTQAPPGPLQLAAAAGLVLVLVDLYFVSRRVLRLPGYGWPFVAFVVALCALSALVRP